MLFTILENLLGAVGSVFWLIVAFYMYPLVLFVLGALFGIVDDFSSSSLMRLDCLTLVQFALEVLHVLIDLFAFTRRMIQALILAVHHQPVSVTSVVSGLETVAESGGTRLSPIVPPQSRLEPECPTDSLDTYGCKGTPPTPPTPPKAVSSSTYGYIEVIFPPLSGHKISRDGGIITLPAARFTEFPVLVRLCRSRSSHDQGKLYKAIEHMQKANWQFGVHSRPRARIHYELDRLRRKMLVALQSDPSEVDVTPDPSSNINEIPCDEGLQHPDGVPSLSTPPHDDAEQLLLGSNDSSRGQSEHVAALPLLAPAVDLPHSPTRSKSHLSSTSRPTSGSEDTKNSASSANTSLLTSHCRSSNATYSMERSLLPPCDITGTNVSVNGLQHSHEGSSEIPPVSAEIVVSSRESLNIPSSLPIVASTTCGAAAKELMAIEKPLEHDSESEHDPPRRSASPPLPSSEHSPPRLSNRLQETDTTADTSIYGTHVILSACLSPVFIAADAAVVSASSEDGAGVTESLPSTGGFSYGPGPDLFYASLRQFHMPGFHPYSRERVRLLSEKRRKAGKCPRRKAKRPRFRKAEAEENAAKVSAMASKEEITTSAEKDRALEPVASSPSTPVQSTPAAKVDETELSGVDVSPEFFPLHGVESQKAIPVKQATASGEAPIDTFLTNCDDTSPTVQYQTQRQQTTVSQSHSARESGSPENEPTSEASPIVSACASSFAPVMNTSEGATPPKVLNTDIDDTPRNAYNFVTEEAHATQSGISLEDGQRISAEGESVEPVQEEEPLVIETAIQDKDEGDDTAPKPEPDSEGLANLLFDPPSVPGSTKSLNERMQIDQLHQEPSAVDHGLAFEKTLLTEPNKNYADLPVEHLQTTSVPPESRTLIGDTLQILSETAGIDSQEGGATNTQQLYSTIRSSETSEEGRRGHVDCEMMFAAPEENNESRRPNEDEDQQGMSVDPPLTILVDEGESFKSMDVDDMGEMLRDSQGSKLTWERSDEFMHGETYTVPADALNDQDESLECSWSSPVRESLDESMFEGQGEASSSPASPIPEQISLLPIGTNSASACAAPVTNTSSAAALWLSPHVNPEQSSFIPAPARAPAPGSLPSFSSQSMPSFSVEVEMSSLSALESLADIASRVERSVSSDSVEASPNDLAPTSAAVFGSVETSSKNPPPEVSRRKATSVHFAEPPVREWAVLKKDEDNCRLKCEDCLLKDCLPIGTLTQFLGACAARRKSQYQNTASLGTVEDIQTIFIKCKKGDSRSFTRRELREDILSHFQELRILHENDLKARFKLDPREIKFIRWCYKEVDNLCARTQHSNRKSQHEEGEPRPAQPVPEGCHLPQSSKPVGKEQAITKAKSPPDPKPSGVSAMSRAASVEASPHGHASGAGGAAVSVAMGNFSKNPSHEVSRQKTASGHFAEPPVPEWVVLKQDADEYRLNCEECLLKGSVSIAALKQLFTACATFEKSKTESDTSIGRAEEVDALFKKCEFEESESFTRAELSKQVVEYIECDLLTMSYAWGLDSVEVEFLKMCLNEVEALLDRTKLTIQCEAQQREPKARSSQPAYKVRSSPKESTSRETRSLPKPKVLGVSGLSPAVNAFASSQPGPSAFVGASTTPTGVAGGVASPAALKYGRSVAASSSWNSPVVTTKPIVSGKGVTWNVGERPPTPLWSASSSPAPQMGYTGPQTLSSSGVFETGQINSSTGLVPPALEWGAYAASFSQVPLTGPTHSAPPIPFPTVQSSTLFSTSKFLSSPVPRAYAQPQIVGSPARVGPLAGPPNSAPPFPPQHEVASPGFSPYGAAFSYSSAPPDSVPSALLNRPSTPINVFQPGWQPSVHTSSPPQTRAYGSAVTPSSDLRTEVIPCPPPTRKGKGKGKAKINLVDGIPIDPALMG